MKTVTPITKNKKLPVRKESKSLEYKLICPDYEEADKDFADVQSAMNYFHENRYSFLDDDNYDDESSHSFELLKNKSFIKFNITELPHCCGLSEIGILNLSATFPVEDMLVILDNILIPGKTFMFNSNGSANCKHLTKALEKSTFWTKVKTFKNSGSKNTITTWISNND